jgi:hypothetical protein
MEDHALASHQVVSSINRPCERSGKRTGTLNTQIGEPSERLAPKTNPALVGAPDQEGAGLPENSELVRQSHQRSGPAAEAVVVELNENVG